MRPYVVSFALGAMLVSEPAGAELPSTSAPPSEAAVTGATPAVASAGLPRPSALGVGTQTAAAPPALANPVGLSPPSVDASGAQGGGEALSSSGATSSKSSDWKFSWNGYFRAPLRIGVGTRPQCPVGMSPAAYGATSLANFLATHVKNDASGNARERLADVANVPQYCRRQYLSS